MARKVRCVVASQQCEWLPLSVMGVNENFWMVRKYLSIKHEFQFQFVMLNHKRGTVKGVKILRKKNQRHEQNIRINRNERRKKKTKEILCRKKLQWRHSLPKTVYAGLCHLPTYHSMRTHHHRRPLLVSYHCCCRLY